MSQAKRPKVGNGILQKLCPYTTQAPIAQLIAGTDAQL